MYYTQCPECGVYFRITVKQLAARQGLVRCGECSAVFRADERLYDKLPANARRISRAKAAKGNKPAPRRAARPRPEPRAPSVSPLILETAPKPGRAGRILWSAASVGLAVLLAGQLVWLYRAELAAQPPLTEYVAMFCEQLGCELPSAHDLHRVEFETSMAPHPRYENALRLRAELINRSARPQPFPRLEVTLTDSAGAVVARRGFAPRLYLAPAVANGEMGTNIAHHVALDLTNPDNRAVGYEVRLLPVE
jgi:predicted Zn finger-like uncharacterized protein